MPGDKTDLHIVYFIIFPEKYILMKSW